MRNTFHDAADILDKHCWSTEYFYIRHNDTCSYCMLGAIVEAAANKIKYPNGIPKYIYDFFNTNEGVAVAHCLERVGNYLTSKLAKVEQVDSDYLSVTLRSIFHEIYDKWLKSHKDDENDIDINHFGDCVTIAEEVEGMYEAFSNYNDNFTADKQDAVRTLNYIGDRWEELKPQCTNQNS